jgi:hypothetical protein
MPVYQLELVKALDTVTNPRTWRNVYHLNTPTLNDANSVADTVLSAEATMHASTVKYVSKIVSDPAKIERRMQTHYTAVSGDRTASGAIIPDWNVLDVIFEPVSNPRVLRKYFRIQLGEGDIVGSEIDSTLISTFQATMDAMVSSVIALCAPNGDTVVAADVRPGVGMRQLQWHRRGRPGFHRGYVPNS